MFQRRHMIVIADILKEQKATYSQIRRWCDMLSRCNSNFDEDKFIKASRWDESLQKY